MDKSNNWELRIATRFIQTFLKQNSHSEYLIPALFEPAALEGGRLIDHPPLISLIRDVVPEGLDEDEFSEGESFYIETVDSPFSFSLRFCRIDIRDHNYAYHLELLMEEMHGDEYSENTDTVRVDWYSDELEKFPNTPEAKHAAFLAANAA